MLYFMTYLIGFMATWVIALTIWVRNEYDSDMDSMDIADWAAGAAWGLGVGIIWPLVALALIPISIVKHAAKSGRRK